MGTSVQSIHSFLIRFRRNRLGVFGIIIVLTIAIGSTLPVFLPNLFHQPWAVSNDSLFPPSQIHLMGTDDLGRDVFSRFMYGAQVTLLIGLVGAFLSTLMGIFAGALSGYYGGVIDAILMRLVDMLWILPTFFVGLFVVAIFGPGLYNVILVIGLLFWPSTARLVRAEMLSLREREFVDAMRLLGMSKMRIVFQELLPNVMSIAIANGTLQIASGILLESGLSFLGLGDPNRPTWGFQLSQARPFLREAWWMALFPGLGIFLTTFSIHVIGDAVNDILNPRLRSSRK